MDLREAVLRIKSGDETVYAEIIDKYSRYLATVIHNVYSLNVQDTEDVIAETILSLWKNAKRLREDLNFNSYLAKIARNKTVDFVRKKRSDIVGLDADTEKSTLVSSGIESDFLQKELVNFINMKIGETKEPDRTIMVLKYHHGLKNKEIADQLGLKQNIYHRHEVEEHFRSLSLVLISNPSI